LVLAVVSHAAWPSATLCFSPGSAVAQLALRAQTLATLFPIQSAMLGCAKWLTTANTKSSVIQQHIRSIDPF